MGFPRSSVWVNMHRIVNLSPALLRQFVLPNLERFAGEYGRLCIHICTEPAPSQHVLPVLCESRHVVAIDNWQGPGPFLGDDAPGRMQASVAVITDVDLPCGEQIERFLNWEPIRSVPRKGGRGIVVHTKASSVDQAKRIYEQWRDRFV